MIEGQITQNEKFIHKRTGTIYVILSGTTDGSNPTQTLAKLGRAGEWIPAVVYYSEHNPFMTFIRDEARFRETFERA